MDMKLPGNTPKIWLLLTVTFAVVVHTFFFQIHLPIALNGFSVLEVLGAQKFPENFIQDFPGGSRESTRTSIVTSLYYPIQNLTGLPGLTLLMIMIGLEIVCVAAGSLVLWRTLVRKGEDTLLEWGYVWLAIILLLSYVIKPDLANFSFPHFHGQFYGFADALRLSAIAFALSRKWRWVAVCLVIGFAVHPIKTIVGGVFILVITLVDWRKSLNLKTISWGALAALLCGMWAYFWLGIGADTGVTRVPVQDFIAYTRIFQVHWYPNDWGLWTYDHERALSPFMGLMLMSLLALSQSKWQTLRVHQFSAGMLVLLLLTIFGFWVSVDQSSSSLVKLCLLRASTLMTLLAPFIILNAMLEKWRGKQWHWIALYVVFLLGGFRIFVNEMAPSLALVAVVLHVWEQRKMSWELAFGTAIVAISTILLWMLYPAIKSPTMLILDRGAVMLVAWAALAIVGFVPSALAASIRLIAVTTVLSVYGVHWGIEARYQSQSTKQLAQNFMEIQLWANQNTKPDDLFMVDPCQNYGWRDFSLRSSIGTPREWYLTAWGYFDDNRLLQRGEAIGKALGLDMALYRTEPGKPQISHSIDVCSAAQTHFYASEHTGLTRMANQFGVDYFIMLKDKALTAGITAAPAIENENYIVYAAKDFLK